jgi:site-specific recombinase XerC/predicted DNA-binding transcriptional regulator AlpA
MRTTPYQIEGQGSDTGRFWPQQLLTVPELCAVFGVSPAWVYKRTKRGAEDPLPVFRLSGRAIRFDRDKISSYLWTRERYRTDATLDAFDGIARVNGKGKCLLTRKRFQTGSVRLRENRGPAYWEGSYREDIVNEAGKTVRRRRGINLGSLAEVKTERAAQQKLAVILEPINDAKHRPKKMMTFRGFIEKYRTLNLANKKGTTVHGYETNIRAHYLPEFGDMQLSEISIEAVQAFINQKAIEGKAVQTLKNFKWGLSAIFVAAIKYGYISSNPARGVDLPPEPVKERLELPTGDQLLALIERLEDPIGEPVWLVSISCVRPEELAFKWIDLDAKKRDLWVVRAVNRGKLHTPKYHRSNRPIRLTQADVERLLALKARVNAKDDDWMFPNSRNTGPIWHEDLLSRRIQPVADELGLPHITWRLLRHWGATQMVEARVPLNAAQERLGHSRPDILLKFYAHVLDASADMAAGTLSGQFGRRFSAPMTTHAAD